MYKIIIDRAQPAFHRDERVEFLFIILMGQIVHSSCQKD
jgi:hypothetical protein